MYRKGEGNNKSNKLLYLNASRYPKVKNKKSTKESQEWRQKE